MLKLISLIKKHWLSLTVIILFSITVLSLSPLPKLPEVPGTDKTHHFLAYGTLTLPISLRKPKFWRLIACLFIIYSGMIELIQPYMNRYAEWLDLVANAGGVVCGLILGALLNSYFDVKGKIPS